ncbi:MAG: hypothetical protein KA144_01175 [Xanthomonadaceae bacterium]|nr:hypothetical protein [Xanthomonadaceae bacterium]
MPQTAETDIRETADRVVALLERNNAREAIELLRRERSEQPLAVQEALDRYVAAGAEQSLRRLQQPGALPANAGQDISPDLERLRSADARPRFPETAEISALASDAQRYDVYASIVETRGNRSAREALDRNQERVILGLRQENNTAASMEYDREGRIIPSQVDSGRGIYDDRIVVLWKDDAGNRHVFEANRANTEPTAQYDAHARGPARPDNFSEVDTLRRAQGEHADRDDVLDLGRLAEGSIVMQHATHPANAGRRAHLQSLGWEGDEEHSFRPTVGEATPPQNRDRVQRDSNGDGWFTNADINGLQELNQSFKIHQGSRNNTDSAGCQTIHPDDYDGFVRAATGVDNLRTIEPDANHPLPGRWHYVLTNTTPGMFRDVNREQAEPARAAERGRDAPHERPQDRQQDRPHDPRMPHPAGRDGPPQGGPEPHDERRAPPGQRGASLMTDPDHIAHPTWLRAQNAMARVEPSALDGLDAQQRERLTAHLAARVLSDTGTGMTDITRIDPSTRTHPNTGQPLGLIPGQGDPETAHYKRVAVDIARAIATPVERSSDIAKTAMDTREQLQTQTLAQAQAFHQDGPSGPAMRMGGRSLSCGEG